MQAYLMVALWHVDGNKIIFDFFLLERKEYSTCRHAQFGAVDGEMPHTVTLYLRELEEVWL